MDENNNNNTNPPGEQPLLVTLLPVIGTALAVVLCIIAFSVTVLWVQLLLIMFAGVSYIAVGISGLKIAANKRERGRALSMLVVGGALTLLTAVLLVVSLL